MKIIPLDSDDDITSICDRLDWAGESQVVLVLPEDGGALREGLDLVRLRRHGLGVGADAQALGAEILDRPLGRQVEGQGQVNVRH